MEFAVGRLIESTGVLETAARQQCVGQDNNGSFRLVRREFRERLVECH